MNEYDYQSSPRVTTSDLDLLLDCDVHWVLNRMGLHGNRTEEKGYRVGEVKITQPVEGSDTPVVGELLLPMGVVAGVSAYMTFSRGDKTVSCILAKDENDAFVISTTVGEMNFPEGLHPVNNATIVPTLIARHVVKCLGVGTVETITDAEVMQQSINAGGYRCPGRKCLWGKRPHYDNRTCKVHSDSCRDYWKAWKTGHTDHHTAGEEYGKVQEALRGLSPQDREMVFTAIRKHHLHADGPDPVDFYVQRADVHGVGNDL